MIGSKLMRTLCLMGVAIVAALMSVSFGATAVASASECNACSPWWYLESESFPRNLPPGGEGRIDVVAEDLGDARPSGNSVVVRDQLPAGEIAKKVNLGLSGVSTDAGELLGQIFCSVLSNEVTCTVPAEALDYSYEFVEVEIAVGVSHEAKSGEQNRASISGGGAVPVSLATPLTVSSASTPFGPSQYELRPENADGSIDTQAGSHPFQLTTGIVLGQNEKVGAPPEALKDLHFMLPAGFVGNPTTVPQCTLATFLKKPEASTEEPACPQNTVVGVASVSYALSLKDLQPYVSEEPVYNLQPTTGEPARFGFYAGDLVPVYLDTAVRAGGDYGVTVNINDISELAGFVSSRVTLWGVPGDPRHDLSRGPCLREPALPACELNESKPQPFFTLPTACTGPVHTVVEADSWGQPGVFDSLEAVVKNLAGESVGMDSCNQLPFTPSVRVTPDGQAGSTPTGLTVDEHVPQEATLNPDGLAESDVKGLSVVLPAGVALNPAAADGLQACAQEAIALESPGPASCPDAAKVGTVKIKTPLLPEPLEGSAYLATQDANPFGSLVALYVYAEDPIAGVRAKATGEVLEDPVTGQLTAHFEGDPVFQQDPRFAAEPEADFLPEVPFEDIELHFFGGDRAPLKTPAHCGAYTTVGTFTPWSESATVQSSSTFDIATGPNGRPCSEPLPFTPTLTAGTTSIQAGGFTPFVMTMSREDGEQDLQGIKLKMPPGMSGTLSTVKLCDETDANAGTCSPETEIGETIVSVGVGGDPYTVKGGKVYITGPYKGAPFGLSIVNPAKAGPFDLGNVIVRAKIEVDPETAELTITTDNSGPYKIPTILDGIPLEIRHVSVSVNRPNFAFNATNCSPLAVTGALTSTEGATSALSVHYQATNCAVLAFKPKLKASTSGKSSRLNGTSLNVKLSYPAGPYDANLSRVKVELPKALPSRLQTLQKACLASVFEANPASCPAASVIGHATATTPVLPVPLTGPAYFVSHGGEAFPSLIIVLQGYGVTVHLVGSTFISKAGITSSTFKTVPDVPVGTFELNLPAGPFSALAALGNLCKDKTLPMPTEFVGQNGAEIHTTTKIAVAGCPKKKSVKHKKRGATHKKRHSKTRRGSKKKR